MRVALVKNVHEIVNKFGPQMIKNFDKERVIDEMKKRRSGKISSAGGGSMAGFSYYDLLEINSAFESLQELGI